MLELIGLHRRYGEVVALDGLSFTVASGQVFGHGALALSQMPVAGAAFVIAGARSARTSCRARPVE